MRRAASTTRRHVGARHRRGALPRGAGRSVVLAGHALKMLGQIESIVYRDARGQRRVHAFTNTPALYRVAGKPIIVATPVKGSRWMEG